MFEISGARDVPGGCRSFSLVLLSIKQKNPNQKCYGTMNSGTNRRGVEVVDTFDNIKRVVSLRRRAVEVVFLTGMKVMKGITQKSLSSASSL